MFILKHLKTLQHRRRKNQQMTQL